MENHQIKHKAHKWANPHGNQSGTPRHEYFSHTSSPKVLILADYRGRGLNYELHQLLDNNVSVLFYPAAGILRSIAKSEQVIKGSCWAQIYSLAGICDLTTKDPNSKLVTIRSSSPEAACSSYNSILEMAYEALSKLVHTDSTKCIFAQSRVSDSMFTTKGPVTRTT